MDIHTDVQYSEYLEEIQRITGPLSRYQLDQLKELIYRIESRCAIGREDISQLTHQQRDYSATENNDATNPRVYSSNLSTTESKNGMSYACNSAVVVNEPVIIPRLDLSCLLDDDSTDKPSSSWDILVWSMSERSNNIKSVKKTHHESKNGMSYTCNSAVVVNEPIVIVIPRLDLSCLLDDESTEKPSSSWDISVRSPSARSNNIKSINEPIVIPRLDLSCLMEGESTEKPSSSWDIPVWSMSERSNNIKPINKPKIEKLDLIFFQNV